MASEWLHENFGVDIRCYRLQLSQENSNDYLTCTCIYPPIEIATLTRGPENKAVQTGTAWANWDAALEGVENASLKDFVRKQLVKHQEARLSTREVVYRIGGSTRFYLGCRRKYAYVWQRGRFDNDEQYWRKVVSEPGHLRAVDDNRALRFHLTTEADFNAFENAMTHDLSTAEFSDPADFNHSATQQSR